MHLKLSDSLKLVSLVARLALLTGLTDMQYQMNEPTPELPLEPEDWRGSDEWAELADYRRILMEELVEERYSKPVYGPHISYATVQALMRPEHYSDDELVF